MTRPQHEINAEIELHRPEREARVRRMKLTATVCEEVAKRMMEGEDAYEPVEIAMDISSAGIATRIKWLREGCDLESDHSLEPPAVDISSEAVAVRIRHLRGGIGDYDDTGDMLEALAAERASAISFHEEADRLRDSLARANADRDRLAIENETLVSGMTQLAERAVASSTVALAEIDRHRTFVRSARRIVQVYASEHPMQIWGDYEQDPAGAHAWLECESAEIGTNRDGGDPKVEKRT